MTKTREIDVPLRFRSGGTFRLRAAAAATEEQPKDARTTRPASGLAYAGGVLMGMGGDVVADLEGMQPLKEGGIPLLYQHRDPIGIVRSVTAGDDGLSYAGEIILTAGKGQEIAAFADTGYPWELSIHAEADADGVEEVHEGQTAMVNGQTVEGPVLIYRQWRLREISIVETGLDSDTEAQIAARAGGGATRRVRVSSPETRTMAETTETGAPPVTSVEALRSAHPELVQQIEAAARQAGTAAERERVASILEATQSALADDPAPEGEQAPAPSPAAEAMAVAASAVNKGDGVHTITAALVKIARRAGGTRAQTPQEARRAVTASAGAVDEGKEDAPAATTTATGAPRTRQGALMASAKAQYAALPAAEKSKWLDERAFVGEQLRAAAAPAGRN